MAEASCRRELELEIPAEEISKASEKKSPRNLPRWRACRDSARARLPFPLIKRRFAEDIKSEVLQNLVPETG